MNKKKSPQFTRSILVIRLRKIENVKHKTNDKDKNKRRSHQNAFAWSLVKMLTKH